MTQLFQRTAASLLIALGMCAASPAMADDTKAMVVVTDDGTQTEFAIPTVDRIDFGAEDFTVITSDNGKKIFAYLDTEKILLNAKMSGIVPVTAPGEMAVWPTVADECIYVSGLESGTTITVYSMGGAVALSAEASETVTTLQLNNLNSGTYLLNAAGKTVKFLKR